MTALLSLWDGAQAQDLRCAIAGRGISIPGSMLSIVTE